MADPQPIEAVAATLEIDVREARKLAAAGVFRGARGKFDVLACVRAYGAHLRSKLPSNAKRIDWAEAQRRFETEDASLTELAPLLGVTVQAVSLHAKRYHWIKLAGIEAEARALAIRAFVTRDANTILANLAEKHALTTRLLRLAGRHAARLEDDALWDKVVGYTKTGEPILVREDPAETLRKLASTVKTIEDTDASLLRDAAWRRGADGEEDDTLDVPEGYDFARFLGPKEGDTVQ